MVPRPRTSFHSRMPAGDATCQEAVEQGVAQLLGGGNDGLRCLYGLVDGVQHLGDGALFWEGRERHNSISSHVKSGLRQFRSDMLVPVMYGRMSLFSLRMKSGSHATSWIGFAFRIH